MTRVALEESQTPWKMGAPAPAPGATDLGIPMADIDKAIGLHQALAFASEAIEDSRFRSHAPTHLHG